MLFPVIDDARWLSNLEATGWLNHVKMVLKGAVNIADKVSSFRGPVSYFNNFSIRSRTTRPLWLCTAVTAGTAHPNWQDSLCYCSTLTTERWKASRWFCQHPPPPPNHRVTQVLIEKEWLSFGHKFAQRVGHGDDKHNDVDRSPVFLLFLDCVWQVISSQRKLEMCIFHFKNPPILKRWCSSFRMPLNSMSICCMLSWTISIPVSLGLFSTIVTKREKTTMWGETLYLRLLL